MLDMTQTLCQQYLNLIYHDAKSDSANKKLISETYGEILYNSADKLLAKLSLSEQDIFFDLGSGLGKIVLQFFLKSPIKEAYGIEIIPELHQQALMAAQKVQLDLPDLYRNNRKLNFILGDFLEIPFNNASIILIGSPCFSPTTLAALGEIINKTPSIHTVLSLRPLMTLERLPFDKAIRVECSWDTALCFIYRDPPSA